MNEVAFILKELQKGHAGDPWHGPSRASGWATGRRWAHRPSRDGEKAVDDLTTAHAEVADASRAMRDGQLDERVGVERDAASGSGVTHREMLHGLAQHDAYHTGQCSILKRLYRGADTRAR